MMLLLFALTIQQPLPVDRIEVNTYKCDSSQITQIILWRWTRLATGHGYRVADWWLTSEETAAMPLGSTYVLRTYCDGKLIELSTQSYDATATTHDPELRDRESLPQDLRRSYFSQAKP